MAASFRLEKSDEIHPLKSRSSAIGDLIRTYLHPKDKIFSNKIWFLLALSGFFAQWLCLKERARASEPDDFAEIFLAVESLQNVNAESLRYIDRGETIRSHLNAAATNLRDSEARLRQLQQASAVTAFLRLQADFMQVLAVSSMETQPPAGLPTGNHHLRGALQRSAVASFMQGIQLQQLDSVSKLAIQNHWRIIEELVNLREELIQWTKENQNYLAKYWEFGDPGLSRTLIENRALLRELEPIDERIGPAVLARGMLRMRLEQYETGEKDLTSVIEARSGISPIALAVRSELYARSGDIKKADRDMKSVFASEKDNLYVRWMRGIRNAAEQNWQEAEADWAVVLKSGRYEATARRYLALIQSARAGTSKLSVAKALDNAQLASALTSGKDWSVEIAHAIALQAAGQFDSAVDKAKVAGSLTTSENKILCTDIASSLSDNKMIRWDFRRTP